MGDLTESSTPQPAAPAKQPSFREDCWSEEATWTLVDTWGRRYLELNRGNLRGKDWQEVADAVNSLHGHTKKTRRTDVQCKNRIDTLKKKYKVEKAKIADSTASTWPFFSRLDFLIGSANANKQHSRPAPPAASPVQTPLLMPPPPPLGLPSPPMAVPIPFRKPLTPAMVTPVVLPQKRPAVDESFFRRNYSAMAAAAAAAATEEAEEEDEESEGEGSGGRAAEEVEEGEDGVRRLAKAIERFGEIYEKVENMKQRQMVELEKQRMQFAKDLEVQRMRLFMDTQVQLEKLKQAKRSGSSDIFS